MQNQLYTNELRQKLSAQIDKICDLVKSENGQHRTDLNDTLESIFCFVINKAKALNLKNLNSGARQEAGLDLGDEEAKICYQITTESRAKKIHETLDQFEKNKKYKIYDKLVIFFANDYTTKLSKLALGKDYSFDIEETVEISNKNILKSEIEKGCGRDTLERIVEYLDKELSLLIDSPTQSIEAIDAILSTCVELIKSRELKPSRKQGLPMAIQGKIDLNFSDFHEADQVRRYLMTSLPYSETISEVINNHVDIDSSDIEAYMQDTYNNLRNKGKEPLEILMSLFERFVPDGKKSDLVYMEWSRRFVLKYFENCTIFKRTKNEIQQELLS